MTMQYMFILRLEFSTPLLLCPVLNLLGLEPHELGTDLFSNLIKRLSCICVGDPENERGRRKGVGDGV